jgi:serine/threonine-protein kinase
VRCPACKTLLDLPSTRFCPVCGSAVGDPLPDPLVGQTLGGRYKILHLVAEGGMGRVYAAEQAMGTTKRKVAIKVLLSEYSGRDQDMQRFMRECATVIELEHPNTIKFYDYGETPEGDLYIAMELLTGPSLAQVLRDGPLSAERVDLIVGQICGSLQEAHDRGIVHRDLKPDNVIITSPGGAPDFVKVLDFGIAKRTGNRDPKLTPLGVVLGSPPYMSPEQFTLQDVDPRSDVYSMGVVAYQMLTGRLPFEAKDPMEWAALHMAASPAPIEGHGAFIPDSMRSSIMRALSKHAEDRPASMRDFYSSFTLGTGTLPPGRAPSVLPRSPSEWPLPSDFPKAPGAPRDLARRASRPDVTTARDASADAPPVASRNPAIAPPPPDAPAAGSGLGAPSMSDEPTHDDEGLSTSQPAISFHELGASHLGSVPAVEAAPVAKKGTLILPVSEPPPKAAPEPRARITMPDLLPPTVREPAGLAAARRGPSRRALGIAAVLLVVVGAVVTAVAWFVWTRDDVPKASRERGAQGGGRAGTLTAPSAKIDVPPDATATPPVSPSAAASAGPREERLSPCQTAVFSAVSGQCDQARRAYARCSSDSPYRPSAERAMTLCP